MAETPSTMLPLGTKAPAFTLWDAQTDTMLSLSDLASPTATVIVFICNHCPYVLHIQHKLSEVADRYHALGIQFIAINANDPHAYPSDSPDKMKAFAEAHHFHFPYLYDETQRIAKAYQAACTPDFYVFDKDLACVYRGRFDDATPGNTNPISGKDLCDALDRILIGEPVSANQKASVGCNIKWKK